MLLAWQEFIRGKRSKPDVQEFQLQLMDDILALHEDLVNKRYKHGPYHHFKINDPKPRDIHKASVRDRLVHHAIYRILYPYFDRKFITDSYSCRLNKGTHKAINRFRSFAYKVSQNHTRTCWVLKCDIRKFFASINHEILMSVLRYSEALDKDTLWLLEEVIGSFHAMTCHSGTMINHSAKGLPLGNLTSQLLVNVYMNVFDQFVKQDLKVKHYIRYADDFVVLSQNREYLEHLLPKIDEFLRERIELQLHPNKVFIKTFASGVDFLGWVHFSNHRVIRRATKRKMLRRLKDYSSSATTKSYRGLLQHGNTRKIQRAIFAEI